MDNNAKQVFKGVADKLKRKLEGLERWEIDLRKREKLLKERVKQLKYNELRFKKRLKESRVVL